MSIRVHWSAQKIKYFCLIKLQPCFELIIELLSMTPLYADRRESLTVLAKFGDDSADSFSGESIPCGETDWAFLWVSIDHEWEFLLSSRMHAESKEELWIRILKNDEGMRIKNLSVPCWRMIHAQLWWNLFLTNTRREQFYRVCGIRPSLCRLRSPNFTFFGRVHAWALRAVKVVGKFFQVAEWADDPESGEWMNSGGDALSDFLWNCKTIRFIAIASID